MRKLAVVLGTPIDELNLSEALDRIEQMVYIGRTCGRVHQVATVNSDFVVQALFDPELLYLLQNADLLTADGMPLVWGMRLLGVPLPGRVTGADLVPALAERAANRGLSIFFLGGAPGVAACAADLLKKKHPQLKVAGICSPAFSPVLEMDTSFLEQIRSTRPDILLVAFGNPKQEKWIGMYGRQLGVPVMIGVGGSLDFVAGQARRAPQWMQRSGLEWFYRLMQEPRRLFRRYAIDLAVFSAFFLRQWWSALPRKSTKRSPSGNLQIIGEKAILNLQGHLGKNSLDLFHKLGQEALRASPCILVNLAQVEHVDSSAMGQLLALGNGARHAGGQLALAAVPLRILKILRLLRMENLFPIYSDVDAYLSAKTTDRSITVAAQFISPDGRTWAVLKGPRVLDASTSQELLDTGAMLLANNPLVICDLSDTVFLASAGLAALASLERIFSSSHAEFRVVLCSKDALRVIKLARFKHLPPVYPNFLQAVS